MNGMNEYDKLSLEYVRNTNGGATADNFIVDYAPIGEKLYLRLVVMGWVTENEQGRIYLTEAGKEALANETK